MEHKKDFKILDFKNDKLRNKPTDNNIDEYSNFGSWMMFNSDLAVIVTNINI